MLKRLPKESRALILLEFTKQLLINSNPSLFKAKEVIKKQEREIGLIRPQNQNNNNVVGKEFEMRQRPVISRPRILRIPEPKLPLNLQYLRPTPTNIEIDLNKLNSLIKDPIVRGIECAGPGEKIVVMVPSPKFTNIILNKDEIKEIINIFEKESKIPSSEGMYNVVVGKLVFSAIISEVIGSKFTIRKMTYAPVFR